MFLRILNLHQLLLLPFCPHHFLQTLLVETVPTREVVKHRIENTLPTVITYLIMIHNVVPILQIGHLLLQKLGILGVLLHILLELLNLVVVPSERVANLLLELRNSNMVIEIWDQILYFDVGFLLLEQLLNVDIRDLHLVKSYFQP